MSVQFAAQVIRNLGMSEIKLWQIARFLRAQRENELLKVWGVEIHTDTFDTEVTLPEPYTFGSVWLQPEQAEELAAMLVAPEPEPPTSWNEPVPELFKTGPNIFYARRWKGDVWGNFPPNASLEYYGLYSREALLPQCFDVLATAAMLLTDVPYVRGGAAWWVDSSPAGGDYVDLFPARTRGSIEEFLRSCGETEYIWTAECGEESPDLSWR